MIKKFWILKNGLTSVILEQPSIIKDSIFGRYLAIENTASSDNLHEHIFNSTILFWDLQSLLKPRLVNRSQSLKMIDVRLSSFITESDSISQWMRLICFKDNLFFSIKSKTRLKL